MVLVAILQPYSATADSPSCGPDATKMYLDAYFGALKSFKQSCGRYPKTGEGLVALATLPKNLKCAFKGSEKPWNISIPVQYPTDGWNSDIKYVSNGNGFRLSASHGYYVTDKSPIHFGLHWENQKIESDQPPNKKCRPNKIDPPPIGGDLVGLIVR